MLEQNRRSGGIPRTKKRGSKVIPGQRIRISTSVPEEQDSSSISNLQQGTDRSQLQQDVCCVCANGTILALMKKTVRTIGLDVILAQLFIGTSRLLQKHRRPLWL